VVAVELLLVALGSVYPYMRLTVAVFVRVWVPAVVGLTTMSMSTDSPT
jgi:hypothetical protein